MLQPSLELSYYPRNAARRPKHHGPTFDEVGMQEKLRCVQNAVDGVKPFRVSSRVF